MISKAGACVGCSRCSTSLTFWFDGLPNVVWAGIYRATTPPAGPTRFAYKWLEMKISSSLYNVVSVSRHFRHFRALSTSTKFKHSKPSLVDPPGPNWLWSVICPGKSRIIAEISFNSLKTCSSIWIPISAYKLRVLWHEHRLDVKFDTGKRLRYISNNLPTISDAVLAEIPQQTKILESRSDLTRVFGFSRNYFDKLHVIF